MDTTRQSDAVIDYTNHRGERASRTVCPQRIFWGKTEWHPQRQWLLDAWDYEKNADRTFACAQIHSWRSVGAKQTVDEMVVTQLKRSMERNARMVNRLNVLAERAVKVNPADLTPHDLLLLVTSGFTEAITSITKDEEPKWPVVLTK